MTLCESWLGVSDMSCFQLYHYLLVHMFHSTFFFFFFYLRRMSDGVLGETEDETSFINQQYLF